MPRRKEVDNKALLKDIKEGISQADLLKKYGFKSAISLKMAQLKALEEEQGIIPIKGTGRSRKSKPIELNVKINSRGSLILPKVLIESMDFKQGESFEVKRTPSGIMLKSVEESRTAQQQSEQEPSDTQSSEQASEQSHLGDQPDKADKADKVEKAEKKERKAKKTED